MCLTKKMPKGCFFLEISFHQCFFKFEMDEGGGREVYSKRWGAARPRGSIYYADLTAWRCPSFRPCATCRLSWRLT